MIGTTEALRKGHLTPAGARRVGVPVGPVEYSMMAYRPDRPPMAHAVYRNGALIAMAVCIGPDGIVEEAP